MAPSCQTTVWQERTENQQEILTQHSSKKVHFNEPFYIYLLAQQGRDENEKNQ
ncbi:hypothetical protein SD77_0291 [Bacillus badius]|uniref:Uncharacterized protein n=1 Tax=Bacillus badius TaxID=1455 RepID=A0ABR5B0G2_BACBA|nr:hypothetical protein SD78_3622 [Bacillus badius]KIL80443.1 hypothetical protein SD77_0291 [Bacillus badius]